MSIRLATPNDLPALKDLLVEIANRGESGTTIEEALKEAERSPDSLKYAMDHGTIILTDPEVNSFFMCESIDEESIEIHICLKPSSRGRVGKILTLEALRSIFTQTPITKIYANVTPGEDRLRPFLTWFNFHSVVNDNDNSLWLLDIEDFITNDPVLALGGCNTQIPIEDSASELQAYFAGFLVACVGNGQTVKGILMYNRFAKLLKWEHLRVVHADPIMLEVGGRQILANQLLLDLEV
jgi:hypothetical protein